MLKKKKVQHPGQVPGAALVMINPGLAWRGPTPEGALKSELDSRGRAGGPTPRLREATLCSTPCALQSHPRGRDGTAGMW